MLKMLYFYTSKLRMNNLHLKFCSILFGLFFLLSCERDDICIVSVTESPDLIVLMLDAEDLTRKKTPSNFSIRAIGSPNPLPSIFNVSLKLPLKIQENITQFEFIQNEGSENQNIDTIQINHKRFDSFINAACGYRSNFILEATPIIILNPGNNWVQGFTILKDTISDETRAHLGILH